MSQSLPLWANLEWLKKQCKERLAKVRAADPAAKLSDVQLAMAREYGFASWRKLKAHVELVREKLDALVPASQTADAEAVPPDDPDLRELLTAVADGEPQKVSDLLTRRPILAKARGTEGQTALHLAAQFNDPKLGVMLLACGADPEAKFGESGHTALSWALTCNSMEFAQTLTRLGTQPDLFCAAGMGSLADVQSKFDESGTLRPGASRTGSSRVAADGTRLPAPPPSAREQIADALYFACRNAHAHVVQWLLTKKPDLGFRAYLGGTALHWAYFGGSQAIVNLLLAAGADAACFDDELKCTPRVFGVALIARWGFTWMLARRLQADPSLAAVTDGQTSPLHEAARSGNLEVVKLLLDSGAPVEGNNVHGQTPLEVARSRGHLKVVELLEA